MEWIRLIREVAWHNAGFSGLRKILPDLIGYEPRYDPTVVPLPISKSEVEAGGERVSLLATERASHLQKPLKLYSVADYRAMYLSGELTPTDVVQAILPLIRRDGSQPGKHSIAWREIQVDRILKAAEESTLRYKKNQSLGPLDGIPSSVKDDYEYDGYATSLGSVNDYFEEAADGTSSTSWAVRKLEEAGSIIIGKLNMHEYGLGVSQHSRLEDPSANLDRYYREQSPPRHTS